jgi:hydroxylamine reductase
LDSTFATLTNVNFDSDRFYQYMAHANKVRNELKAQAESLGIDPKSLTGPAHFDYMANQDALLLEAKSHGVLARKAVMGDDNALVVREMAMYGIKGTAAYYNHAERLRKTNPSAFTEEEREGCYSKLYQTLSAIAPSRPALGDMLQNALAVGELNLKVMELLDRAHTSTFGHPVPTTVSTRPTEGKCILVSGHDIVDLHALLKQTEGTGINVYTHGEMLPAHSYPELKKFPHLKGHYGNAWQRQKIDFARFPGSILLTSNCLVEPMPSYRDRIFTTNSVGFSNVKHLGEFDFGPLIESAQKSAGFKASDTTKKTSTRDELLIGFGHHTVLSVADQVVDAVKQGHLKNIFVIGGCDGAEGERNYFTQLGDQLPQDAIALTMGCGKFRINGKDMGTLPNGIPRLLDFGQCNDSYGAVKVALALADVMKTDVNGLPLHFAVSWFEQKAVAVLLTLLHLGVKNIYLGPNLPAFLTPPVLDVLVEKFQLHPTSNATADLQAMIARTAA